MSGRTEEHTIDYYLQIPVKNILPDTLNPEPEFKFQIPGREETSPLTGTTRKPSRKSRKSESQHNALQAMTSISAYLENLNENTSKEEYDALSSQRAQIDELIKPFGENGARGDLETRILQYNAMNNALETIYALAANN